MRRDGRVWRRSTSVLAERGYEVLSERLLDPSECDRLVAVTDSLLGTTSRPLSRSASFIRRGEGGGRDTHVSQVMNAQDLDAGLATLLESGRLQSLLTERLGGDVVIESITLQFDGIDTQTKRGFHIDRFTPPNFKVFVYLNDVLLPGDGPYTVVPRSHRHVARKLLNAVVNEVRGRPLTDMNHFYCDPKSVSMFGEKGTSILSIQTMVHKGWHHQDLQSRIVLIAYCAFARSPTHRGEFTLGRDHA